MATSKSGRFYSRAEAWQLFLIAAFPLHVWALVLVFRDFSWMSERSNAWDAVGLGGYGLLFALLESLVFFAFILLLGLLISKGWGAEKRLALLSLLALIIAGWAILDQLYFLLELHPPAWLVQFLAAQAHPLRVIYAVLLVLITLTVALPVYLVLRSEQAPAVVQGLSERIGLLMTLYLVLDLAGVLLILFRNLT